MKTFITVLLLVVCNSLFAYSENEANAMRHILRAPGSTLTVINYPYTGSNDGVKLKVCPPADINDGVKVVKDPPMEITTLTPSTSTNSNTVTPKRDYKAVNVNVSIYVKLTVIKW